MTMRSLLRGAAALALAAGLLASALPLRAAAAADAVPTCDGALTTSAIQAELSSAASDSNMTPVAAFAVAAAARPFCVTCNCEACCLPYLPLGSQAYSTCIVACQFTCR